MNNAALRILVDAVAAEIQGQRDKGTVVDAFMGWREWVPGQKFLPKDTKRFPFNWDWDEWHKKWFDHRVERENWETPPQEQSRPRQVLRGEPRLHITPPQLSSTDVERHREIVAKRKTSFPHLFGEEKD